MKKIIFIVLNLFILLFTFNVNAASINKTNFTIYAMADSYKEYISIPSNYKTKDKIVVTGSSNVSYNIASGYTVKVGTDGTIEPNYYTYSNGNKNYYFGESKIYVYIDNKLTYTVTVNIINYAKVNAENVMNKYLDEHITSNMTEYQKMQQIVELMKTTSYNAGYASYAGLFSGPGADCWGSTDAINYMGEKLGIKVRARNGNLDPGAGGGHMNNVAMLDGELYEIDGGYYEDPPRYVAFRKRTLPYSVNYEEIYQYDGFDEEISIPTNEKYTTLGNKFLPRSYNKIKKVTIGNNITNIKYGAFITTAPLEEIVVSNDNPNYKTVDGVLYSKDMKTLITYPNSKKDKSFTIPEGVETISDSAFYGSIVENITFSNSLKKIEKNAFASTKQLKKLIIPENVNEIGEDIVKSSGVEVVYILNKNTTFDNNACNRLFYGYEGSTLEEYANNNQSCKFGVITDVNKINDSKSLNNVSYNTDKAVYHETSKKYFISITDGNYELKENIDYIMDTNNLTDAYPYGNVIFKGIGKYYGIITKYIYFKKNLTYEFRNPTAYITDDVKCVSPDIVFTPEKHNADVYMDNRLVYTPNWGTSYYPVYCEVGTYKIKMETKWGNYIPINDTLTFVVKKGISIKKTNIEVKDVPYIEGQSNNPYVKVTYNGKELVKDKDYNLTINNNEVTINGINDYFESVTKSYNVVKDYNISFPNNKVIVEIGDTIDSTINNNKNLYIDSSLIKFTSNNTKIVNIENRKIVAKGIGTTKVNATVDNKTTEMTVEVRKKVTKVSYTTHVQNIGWQSYVKNGAIAGTSGKALRLEGIKIKLEDQEYSGNVEYQTHIQNIGWEKEYKKNNEMSGTSGMSYRLEAIRIKLTGEIANHYDIYYRVHAENFGWLDWTKNGESAGTAGYAYRLEGIEIKLVEKGGKAPGATTNPFRQRFISYQTHVQNIGWQENKYDGEMSGTSGKSLRLEGIKINLENQKYSGNVEYKTHIQNIGWEKAFKKNREMSGTSGMSYRLEAIQIKLTGEMAEHYDIYYRVHAENFGWLDWTKNGASAGTAGYAYRLEGIEIKLVEKGGTAPGKTTRPFVEK